MPKRDLDDLVDQGGVEIARDEACADALDLVGAGLAAGNDRALCRLHRHNLHVTTAAHVDASASMQTAAERFQHAQE